MASEIILGFSGSLSATPQGNDSDAFFLTSPLSFAGVTHCVSGGALHAGGLGVNSSGSCELHASLAFFVSRPGQCNQNALTSLGLIMLCVTDNLVPSQGI